MPRSAIIDQTVSAGGAERFLHGLLVGAIEARIIDDWEIALVWAPRVLWRAQCEEARRPAKEAKEIVPQIFCWRR